MEITSFGTGGKITGKRLAERFGLKLKHALYRRTGDWYHILERFPAALFDQAGYLFFNEKESYTAFTRQDGVKEYRDSNTLAILGGIASLPGYISTISERADEILEAGYVWEGARTTVVVNAYERNRTARTTCISHWGPQCAVCDFDFGRSYGPAGDGFIHVHHLVPLGTIRNSYQLNPIKDLRPVCPNCHAMLHRQEPPMSIEALKETVDNCRAAAQERNS